MQHLDEGTIHAWLDGALPPAEQDAAANHVAHCPECAAAVADARGMIAGASRILSTLDTVPGGVLPRGAASKRRRSMWRALHLTPARAALAASLMVAAAGALAVRYQRSANPNAQASIRTAALAPAPAATPAAPLSPAPAPEQPAATATRAVHKAGIAEQSFASGTARRKRPDSTAESAAPAPTPAPPPSAAPERAATAVAKARLDSLTPISPTSAAGANAAVAAASPRVTSADRVMERQRSSRRMPLPFSVEGAQPGFAGCYEISNDSAAGALHIPMRFALQRGAPLARGGQMRLVAVALTADGRTDTLAAQGTWRSVDANTAAVSWIADSAPATVTIHFTSPPLSAEVETAGTKVSLNVARIDCRP